MADDQIKPPWGDERTKTGLPVLTKKWADMTEAERLMYEEEKARIQGRDGSRGGRPPGSKNILPLGAVKFLRSARFRVRKDIPEDQQEAAADLAGYALERATQVLAGTMHSRKAPSILKAATMIREEICEPVVKETKLSGGLSLASLVAQAAALEEPKK